MDQADPAGALKDMCVYMRIRLKKLRFFSRVPSTMVATAITTRSTDSITPATGTKLDKAVADPVKTDRPLDLGYSTVLYFRSNDYDDRRQLGIAEWGKWRSTY